jgi:hypothetical protein
MERQTRMTSHGDIQTYGNGRELVEAAMNIDACPCRPALDGISIGIRSNSGAIFTGQSTR